MPRGPIETLASNLYVSDDPDLSTFGSEACKYSFDQDSDSDPGDSCLLLSNTYVYSHKRLSVSATPQLALILWV